MSYSIHTVYVVWGTEFIQFQAALAVLHQDDRQKRINCTRMIWIKWWIHPCLRIVLVENSKRGKELNKFYPLNSSDDLCLVFCINPSFMSAWRLQYVQKCVKNFCSGQYGWIREWRLACELYCTMYIVQTLTVHVHVRTRPLQMGIYRCFFLKNL